MNSFGSRYRVTIFGESHGEMVGAVLDGVPAGMNLSENDFLPDIGRRRSGASGTTPRKEQDLPHIASGVYQGHTTGTPLYVSFANADIRSDDYAAFADVPRPGHADFSASVKYDGFNDPRGGGQFSGRMTLPVVAAGVVAKKMLASHGIGSIDAKLIEVGGLAEPREWDASIAEAAQDGDSLGGIVECCVESIPAGIGEPFWDSVESVISHAIFAIPGVRGVEFGDGFAASRMKGSAHNDPFGPDGKPARNGAGGINGGITNGAPVIFRVAFKPTASISRQQETFNFRTKENDVLCAKGRHDVCFALRTPVIVEAMTAIALANLV